MSSIEKYNIIKTIGKGGMGRICLAKEKATGKAVAIKYLKNRSDDDLEFKRNLTRFQNEIKTLKKVKSNYVAEYYDSFLSKDPSHESYIVMEYIEGRTLKNLLNKGKVPLEEIIDICKQLALGFDATHKAGIIHRDIKPSNILVTEHNFVKIVDFGIAVSEETLKVTRSGNIVGSASYTAPEFLDLGTPSVKSDIYSFGILIYEMLVGKPPFTASTAKELVFKHKNQSVPYVSRVNSQIPKSLSNIVKKATVRDSGFRYNSMYEIYEDLLTCLNKERLLEEELNITTGKKKSTFVDFINSKGMRNLLIGLLFVVVVLLIVIVVLYIGEV